MNFYAPAVEATEVEMTAEGQIIIPEAVRKAKGFAPGAKLVIGVNDRGDAVIMTRIQVKRFQETPEQRRARIISAIDEVAGRFSTGQATDEIMRELRGDREG